MTRHDHPSRGQGLTEYVIAVVLVAIALIAAITIYRNAVDNKAAESTAHVSNLPSSGGDGEK